jgi:hypothetical protein
MLVALGAGPLASSGALVALLQASRLDAASPDTHRPRAVHAGVRASFNE